MFLSNIKLTNYKNHLDFSGEFDPRINCFTGDNGIGKTNLLDAIFYLCSCKSYFSGVETFNINHQSDYFILKGDFQCNEEVHEIVCSVEKSKKKVFKRNNKVYKRLADHIGKLPIVVVAPNDISLILEGSTERRKFIDLCISQYDATYLNELIKYNRVLQQRNSLLKNFAKYRSFEQTSLDIWTEQLLAPAAYIYEQRKKFVTEFNPSFQEAYKQVAGEVAEKPSITYRSVLENADFAQILQENLIKDRQAQITTAGIHKDDFELNLNEYPIKKVGSQGQMKTFLIALKFAKFQILKKHSSNTPIILLDDIFDKLDKQRVANIVRLVAQDNFNQIFITDTNKERLNTILKELDISSKIIEL